MLTYCPCTTWSAREPAFLYEHEPEHQLEELAQWADGQRHSLIAGRPG
jgi:hypothetical protein